jgi:hypothetical protein
VEPVDWEMQMSRQGKLCNIFETLTRAGMRVSAREFLAAASAPFLDAVSHFGRGPGWRFLRELVELAELVERESDEETKRCA